MAMAGKAAVQSNGGDVFSGTQQLPLGSTQSLLDDVLSWGDPEGSLKGDQKLMGREFGNFGQIGDSNPLFEVVVNPLTQST